MKKIYPTEAQEQKAVIEYFSHTWVGDYLIHIPNGGARSSAREGKNLKLMGVKAGVSDLFLAYPIYKDFKIEYCGLWIELKRNIHHYPTEKATNNAITESQQKWLCRMNRSEYDVNIAYGADDAIKIIKDYTDYPETSKPREPYWVKCKRELDSQYKRL
jgi:hypothetical protein